MFRNVEKTSFLFSIRSICMCIHKHVYVPSKTHKISMKNHFRLYPEVRSNRFIFMTFAMMASIKKKREHKKWGKNKWPRLSRYAFYIWMKCSKVIVMFCLLRGVTWLYNECREKQVDTLKEMWKKSLLKGSTFYLYTHILYVWWFVNMWDFNEISNIQGSFVCSLMMPTSPLLSL